MVPDKLCKMPTLMVSAANAGSAERVVSATAAVSALSVKRREFKDCMCYSRVDETVVDAFRSDGIDFRESQQFGKYAEWRR
jgi:hypothetical protein